MDENRAKHNLEHWEGKNKYIVNAAKKVLKNVVPIEKPVEKPKVVPVEKPKPVKLTEKEAYDLNKDEQVKLLVKLGSKKIPRFEKQRVQLILKLQ